MACGSTELTRRSGERTQLHSRSRPNRAPGGGASSPAMFDRSNWFFVISLLSSVVPCHFAERRSVRCRSTDGWAHELVSRTRKAGQIHSVRADEAGVMLRLCPLGGGTLERSELRSTRAAPIRLG